MQTFLSCIRLETSLGSGSGFRSLRLLQAFSASLRRRGAAEGHGVPDGGRETETGRNLARRKRLNGGHSSNRPDLSFCDLLGFADLLFFLFFPPSWFQKVTACSSQVLWASEALGEREPSCARLHPFVATRFVLIRVWRKGVRSQCVRRSLLIASSWGFRPHVI